MRENEMSFRNRRTLNQREKSMALAYVLLLFLVTTFCCCMLIYWTNSDFNVLKQKQAVLVKMDKIKKFQDAQSGNKSVVDSLYNRISGLKPGINAQYEEDDIKYLLNDLRNIYQNNGWDNRYKVFLHVADFYQMWLTDRKELWSKRENIITFKKNLEECEIGLESKKQDWRSGVKK
jgi:hypothetical protein